MSVARGIRNNNPGNIDYNPANNWQGQLKVDKTIEPRFCRFDTPENGIRALGKLLQTYQSKYGLTTVEGIINRWAPSVENNTKAYVRSVEKTIGSIPGATITLKDPRTLGLFIKAIIRHENSNYEYSDAIMSEGVRRALA
jgi:hypothetical protein